MDTSAKIKKDIIHFDTGRSWRGGQNQVFLLARELAKKDIKQILVSPFGSPLYKKVSKLGIEVLPLEPKNDIDLKAGLKLRKIIKARLPAIVHCHTSRALGISSWSLKGLPLKTVVTRRIGLPVSGNMLNKMKYDSADVIVAISGFIRRQLESSGFKNIEKIYSSVEIEKYEYSREYEDKKNITVGMAGAFNLTDKDYITFIKSAVYLKEKLNTGKVKFLIAGSGPDEQKIKNQIEKSGLSEIVKMEGFVSDMGDFFQKLDILAHTVNFEGLGTVILQGMASGLPVVATGVGGIPEAVEDGVNGFLVTKNDYRAVAQKIRQLSIDTRMRERMGTESSKKVSASFSPLIMAEKYMEIYGGL